MALQSAMPLARHRRSPAISLVLRLAGLGAGARPHQDRLQHADAADALGELLELLLVEALARVRLTRRHQGERDVDRAVDGGAMRTRFEYCGHVSLSADDA
jgi:hypothetical protein